MPKRLFNATFYATRGKHYENVKFDVNVRTRIKRSRLSMFGYLAST